MTEEFIASSNHKQLNIAIVHPRNLRKKLIF